MEKKEHVVFRRFVDSTSFVLLFLLKIFLSFFFVRSSFRRKPLGVVVLLPYDVILGPDSRKMPCGVKCKG